MSENRGKQEKRSFVIYTDSLDVLDNMSDEELAEEVADALAELE